MHNVTPSESSVVLYAPGRAFILLIVSLNGPCNRLHQCLQCPDKSVSDVSVLHSLVPLKALMNDRKGSEVGFVGVTPRSDNRLGEFVEGLRECACACEGRELPSTVAGNRVRLQISKEVAKVLCQFIEPLANEFGM